MKQEASPGVSRGVSPPSSPHSRGSGSLLRSGLVMVPAALPDAPPEGPPTYLPHHRRLGSTGTTAGDSSYASDEEREAELDTDEVDATTLVEDNSSSSHNNDELQRLREELCSVRHMLNLKEEELEKLKKVRVDADAELEDLTASLFQEAHSMVRLANERAAAQERVAQEARMRCDMLSAEVAALKALVLTSTPSAPYQRTPTQHGGMANNASSLDRNGTTIFSRKHRRSPSHSNLKYGRDDCSSADCRVKDESIHLTANSGESDTTKEQGPEVDPIFHKEFIAWRERPKLCRDNVFMCRIYNEDIDPCLTFSNQELAENVAKAVETGTILVEAVADKAKATFPRKCALLEIPRLCFYRMNIGDGEWYSISQICRNKIIAVCDFLNYLKYIERGLVKSSVHDVYWEIIRLRKNISLARLGLNLDV